MYLIVLIQSDQHEKLPLPPKDQRKHDFIHASMLSFVYSIEVRKRNKNMGGIESYMYLIVLIQSDQHEKLPLPPKD